MNELCSFSCVFYACITSLCIVSSEVDYGRYEYVKKFSKKKIENNTWIERVLHSLYCKTLSLKSQILDSIYVYVLDCCFSFIDKVYSYLLSKNLQSLMPLGVINPVLSILYTIAAYVFLQIYILSVDLVHSKSQLTAARKFR